MGLELHQAYPNGTVIKTGSISVSIPSGKRIVFRSHGGGTEDKFFDEEVPEGKTWELTVSVSVKET
jgi:hypothetical protein